MGSVKNNAHNDTGKGTSNWDGKDPGNHEEGDSLEVNGLEGTIAETDTDGGTSNAHGGGDWKRVLREEEDGDSGTHFHGAASAGGVVGDLVAHDSHDVVSVKSETQAKNNSDDSDLPDWNWSLSSLSVTGGPGSVDDSPWADSVTNIVGTVSEGGSAGSDDLDEGESVLGFVGVLGGIVVDTLHTGTVRSTFNTGLGSVDIVVNTVEGTGNNDSWETLEENLHIGKFVDLSVAHWVLVESSHSPAKRTALLPESGVHSLFGLFDEFFVGELLNFVLDKVLLVDFGVGFVDGALSADFWGIIELVVLDDGVVWNLGDFSIWWGWAAEQERTVDDHPWLESVILLDDLGVEVWDEEEGREDAKTETSSQSDGGDVPCWLLVETELWGTLVDDGEGTNGTGDQEEHWGRPNSPDRWVLSEMDDELDEHEDSSTKAGSNSWSHKETSEDGTETLALVPSPLDLPSTNGGDTDTSDGRDEGVGGGDVSGVPGTPHDPGGSTSKSASEGKHLNTGITTESRVGDNSVLDSICGSSTDSNSTDDFKDSSENHGLSVCYRTGRD